MTVGPNCTSHLFTMEELEACTYVSSEAPLRWPTVCYMVNNAGPSTLAFCTLSPLLHTEEILDPLHEKTAFIKLADVATSHFITDKSFYRPVLSH